MVLGLVVTPVVGIFMSENLAVGSSTTKKHRSYYETIESHISSFYNRIKNLFAGRENNTPTSSVQTRNNNANISNDRIERDVETVKVKVSGSKPPLTFGSKNNVIQRTTSSNFNYRSHVNRS